MESSARDLPSAIMKDECAQIVSIERPVITQSSRHKNETRDDRSGFDRPDACLWESVVSRGDCRIERGGAGLARICTRGWKSCPAGTYRKGPLSNRLRPRFQERVDSWVQQRVLTWRLGMGVTGGKKRRVPTLRLEMHGVEHDPLARLNRVRLQTLLLLLYSR